MLLVNLQIHAKNNASKYSRFGQLQKEWNLDSLTLKFKENDIAVWLKVERLISLFDKHVIKYICKLSRLRAIAKKAVPTVWPWKWTSRISMINLVDV